MSAIKVECCGCGHLIAEAQTGEIMFVCEIELELSCVTSYNNGKYIFVNFICKSYNGKYFLLILCGKIHRYVESTQSTVIISMTLYITKTTKIVEVV